MNELWMDYQWTENKCRMNWEWVYIELINCEWILYELSMNFNDMWKNYLYWIVNELLPN